MSKRNQMTPAAAGRIQSAEARRNGGQTSKGAFGARAQAAAAKNNPPPRPAPTNPNWPSKTGNKSGGGRGNNPSKSK